MIVFQIDVDGVAVRPAECDPPVSAGVDRIAALVAAEERRKTEARQVHVLRPGCVIERAQDVANPSRTLDAEPAPVSRREETFEGLLSDRPDYLRV
jgi:hypothetical protein